MEKSSSSIAAKVGIAATVVSLVGGTVALWDQFKPADEHPDLSGRWTITNTVTGSDSGDFDGEIYIYDVGVTQGADNALQGKGEQTRYNGASAPGRWPILIEAGKVTAEKVVASFTIHGNRVFTGTLKLTADPGDPSHLSGTFSYTADGTRGTTEVRIE